MPFDFDEGEYKDSVEAIVDGALAAQPIPQEEEFAILDDVDLRLATADYYRAILGHDFFEVEGSAAEIVDREIRAFIKGRLEILLGLRDARAPSSIFSGEEIEALKLLAAKSEALALLATKVEQKPGLVQTKKTISTDKSMRPQPRKVSAPAQTTSTKSQTRVQQKPSIQPLTKPVASVPVVIDRTIDGGETQTFIGIDGKQVTLTEGDIIEEGGQRFMVAKNERGTLYRRNITGQVAAPSRLPPMSYHQMNALANQQNEINLERLDTLTGAAILGSLRR